jgi:hypothetical protein
MAFKYPLVGDLLKEMASAEILTGNPARATGTPRPKYPQPSDAPTIMGSPRRKK